MPFWADAMRAVLWTQVFQRGREEIWFLTNGSSVKNADPSLIPEMYPARTHQPYARFRYFFTKDWCVSYTMSEEDIVILAVFPARSGKFNRSA
jgi:hypothetical protein